MSFGRIQNLVGLKVISTRGYTHNPKYKYVEPRYILFSNKKQY